MTVGGEMSVWQSGRRAGGPGRSTPARPRLAVRWLLVMIWLSVVALAGHMPPPAEAAPLAQTAPFCGAGETPNFNPPFDKLIERIPWSALGEPVECQHTEANGDVLQKTRKGTLFLRKGTTTPIYTSGNDNWVLTPSGAVIQWPNDLPADFLNFAGGIPADALAALPAGVRPLSAITAFLTGPGIADPGRGVPDWVILYTASPPDTPSGDVTAAFVTFSALGRYSALKSVKLEGVVGASIGTVQVGVRPAVVVSAGQGAHGIRTVVVRWDSDKSEFAAVFDGESNAPTIDVSDVDSDGMPEVVVWFSPYCESYAASPRLVTVYRWSGTSYVEATGSYPTLVRKVADDVRAVLPAAGEWSANGRACLYWALGYLAERIGDVDTAAAQYGLAKATDPAYDLGPTSITPVVPSATPSAGTPAGSATVATSGTATASATGTTTPAGPASPTASAAASASPAGGSPTATRTPEPARTGTPTPTPPAGIPVVTLTPPGPGGAGASPTPSASPAASGSPAATTSATPAGTASASPSPSASPVPTVTARLAVNGLARVTGVGPDRLNVRSAPSITADIVDRLPDGTRLRLLEGPRSGDNFAWWRVAREGENVTLGWVVSDYLQPIASAAPPPVGAVE